MTDQRERSSSIYDRLPLGESPATPVLFGRRDISVPRLAAEIRNRAGRIIQMSNIDHIPSRRLLIEFRESLVQAKLLTSEARKKFGRPETFARWIPEKGNIRLMIALGGAVIGAAILGAEIVRGGRDIQHLYELAKKGRAARKRQAIEYKKRKIFKTSWEESKRSGIVGLVDNLTSKK